MEKTKNSNSAGGNFFTNLFSSIFKSANPEMEKKRRLKAIVKSFSKTKYHSFYKPSTYEVQPQFAKLFYDLYKICAPAQAVFKANPNAGLFKHQIINYSLSEKQTSLLESLSMEAIQELSRTMDLDAINDKVEEYLINFQNEFTPERVTKIENLYKSFVAFRDFCSYDYYMLIKRFAPGLVENNFDAVPEFRKSNAEFIADDLKDFIAVAYSITDNRIAWSDLFDFLKVSRGSELVPQGTWKKIIAKISSIQSSQAFDLMLRHILSSPDYIPEVRETQEQIVDPYVTQIEEEAHNVLKKMNKAQKESKASSICMQIFGSVDIQNLKYYTPELNPALDRKNLKFFTLTEPLNFLKTFLLEYVKKDIREFFDVIVIRGQWDSTLSAPVSEAYQDLLKLSDQITEFDNSISVDDGTIGLKIKTLLPKTAHDSGAENIINRLIDDANNQAKNFITTGTKKLITIGKTLTQLIEDYMKPQPVIVQNWKELERYLEKPMKEFGVTIYKKIYLFVQLMQQYLAN